MKGKSTIARSMPRPVPLRRRERALELEASKASVLVIDDHADILNLCVRTLKTVCSAVEGVSSCAAARAAFHENAYDLVLTDINVDAEGDGVELAAEIKMLSPSTIVTIMTGAPLLETAISSLQIGALEYIVKPFSPEHLESLVRSAFEKSRLFSALEREKDMKRELEEAYFVLSESERVKDAFLGKLNHELRTPLTIAVTATKLLGPEQKEEKPRKLWESSSLALNNLKNVIEELLLFSDLVSGSVKLSKEPCDLPQLLEQAAKSTEFLYKNIGVELKLSTEGAPAAVTADPEKLEIVFRHLLSNAAKFSSRGDSVSAQVVCLPKLVTIRFTDMGCGVSEDLLPHLFDGFFQVACHLTRTVGGLGLGLATVKHLVEAHGGAVLALRNQHGPGMTLTVSLPR